MRIKNKKYKNSSTLCAIDAHKQCQKYTMCCAGDKNVRNCFNYFFQFLQLRWQSFFCFCRSEFAFFYGSAISIRFKVNCINYAHQRGQPESMCVCAQYLFLINLIFVFARILIFFFHFCFVASLPVQLLVSCVAAAAMCVCVREGAACVCVHV